MEMTIITSFSFIQVGRASITVHNGFEITRHKEVSHTILAQIQQIVRQTDRQTDRATNKTKNITLKLRGSTLVIRIWLLQTSDSDD